MKQDVFKFPEDLAEKIKADRLENTKTVLGLDLGTSCGYSYRFINKDNISKPVVYAGQLDLSAGPYDSGAIRFVKLRHFLSAIKPDMVAFEDVKYTPPKMGRSEEHTSELQSH